LNAMDRASLMLDQIDDLADAGNPLAEKIRGLAWRLPDEPGPLQRSILEAIRTAIHQLNRELNNEWRMKEVL
jgi:hypothetical protein